MADDPYTVLGVDPGADLTEIRRAYLARLRASHPDLRPGDAAAEERTRDLNRAWEQVRARRAAAARRPATTHPHPTASTHRPRHRAYSAHRRDVRTAFTAATLRVALALLAFGLLLLLAVVR